MCAGRPAAVGYQPGSLKGEHHLVDGGRTDPEVPLQICFGGRPAGHARMSVDEGQIMTLLWRESRHRGGRRHRWALGRRSRIGKRVH
jgi:hypothetical protein